MYKVVVCFHHMIGRVEDIDKNVFSLTAGNIDFNTWSFFFCFNFIAMIFMQAKQLEKFGKKDE